MRRLHSTWRVLGVTLALGITAACHDDADIAGPTDAPPSPRATVASADAEIEDSHGTDFLGPRYAAYTCSFDDGPIVIDGTVDLSQVKGSGNVVMIGLIDRVLLSDPGLYSSPFDTWGSGAYAYFFPGAASTRIGPTDGFNGGEIVQNFVDAPPTSDDVYDFQLTVDPSGNVTVRYDGTDITDTYGELEDYTTPFDPTGNDVYPHDEFEFGAVVGIDVTSGTPEFSYRLDLVSGCAPADGFVTGGGWIDSPAGAFMPGDPGDATVVTAANLGVDWLLTELTGSAGEFVDGPGTPPLGEGSFSMSLQDASGKVTLFNGDHVGTPLADIESISYATYRSSASTNPVAQYPALNVQVDYVGDGSSFTTLVFEPIYPFGQSALLTDTWQTWDAMAPSQTSFDGGWWSTNAIPGVCAFNCFVSWDDIVAANPNAKISGGVGVNIGSGWNGMFSGATDALSLTVDGATTTYDFEADAPFNPVGKATFGFVARYKKGAQAPDGNAEFRFQAAELNFHSTSYDWLVVNQGGENAQFKGEGTVNGAGLYKFMLWAGDHDTGDTFRIRITDGATGDVVYDNGMSQPIGGGSIVIHDKKKGKG